MRQEKILLFGPAGSGKTRAAIEVVKMFRLKTYVLDSDDAWAIQAEGIPNVEVFPCHSWDDWDRSMTTVSSRAVAGDLIVVDRVDEPWRDIMNAYCEKRYGVSLDEYLLERQIEQGQKGKKFIGNPLVTDGAYQVVNPMYLSWERKMHRSPAHVIALAAAKKIYAEGKFEDKDELKHVYGSGGLKPGGQSEMSFRFHSILMMLQRRTRQWELTTLRERDPVAGSGRRWFDHEPLFNFAAQYLVATAGWRPPVA